MSIGSKKSRQSLLTRLIINGGLLYLVTYLYSPGYIDSLNSAWDVILAFTIASIVFSVLNAIVKPILVLLTLPVVTITLGLFTLLINGIILYLTALLVPNLAFNFTDAIIGGIIISLANFLITNIFLKGKK